MCHRRALLTTELRRNGVDGRGQIHDVVGVRLREVGEIRQKLRTAIALLGHVVGKDFGMWSGVVAAACLTLELKV